MLHTLKAIYDDYQIKYDDSIDAKTFRDICSDYNMIVMSNVLEGKTFNMGYNLSSIYIVRVRRDPRTPRIDWGESNKYRDELIKKGLPLYDNITEKGRKWYIYYTDDFYCKYHWNKGKCKIPNKSVYRFDATRGVKGNKGKLITLLRKDDLAYLKFKKYKL